VLPATAVFVMRRWLPDVGPPARSSGLRRSGIFAQMRNPLLLRIAFAAAAMFFTFVGVFSYAVFRLQRPPFDLGPAVSSLIFLLWLFGAVGPYAGKLADRFGWRRAAFASVVCAGLGVLLSIPSTLPTLGLGLSLVTVSMFAGVTALQLGVTSAAQVDRGAASAVYFSIYYGCGAIGGYVPGLAWQAWRWNGVACVALAAVAVAALALLSSRGTASSRPRASRLARSG
jgi:YNFM family putative membrane transporter